MEWIAIIGFSLVVWAGMLWGSIKVIDRNNPHNTFVMALVWSAVNLAINLVMMKAGLLGLVIAVAYLIGMVRVLMRHYELGVLQTIGVIGLMIAVPYVATPILFEFAGGSGVRGLLILIGLPAGILITWYFGRRHALHRAEREGLPEARVVRREPPAPVAAPQRVSAPKLPTPAAPAVAAVPVIEPKVSVAPPAEPAALPNEGPRFLR
jgi:hypothetical protein